MKIIDGKKYDTTKAKEIGSVSKGFLKCEKLYQKASGEYFIAELSSKNGTQITPISNFEAIKWGNNHLADGTFKTIFGAAKDDFIALDKGKVFHHRIIYPYGYKSGYVQKDKITATISLDFIEKDDLDKKLWYWCVEDFDSAHIDWKNHQIVLEYKTEHTISKEDIPDMLEGPDTVECIR